MEIFKTNQNKAERILRLIVSLLEQGQPISRLAGKSMQDLRNLVIQEKI